MCAHTWTFSRISCSLPLVWTAEVRICSRQGTLGWLLRKPRTKNSKVQSMPSGLDWSSWFRLRQPCNTWDLNNLKKTTWPTVWYSRYRWMISLPLPQVSFDLRHWGMRPANNGLNGLKQHQSHSLQPRCCSLQHVLCVFHSKLTDFSQIGSFSVQWFDGISYRLVI